MRGKKPRICSYVQVAGCRMAEPDAHGGSGYVRFARPEDAEAAMSILHFFLA